MEIMVELGFDRFPVEHTCEGKNISPSIRISGAKGVSMAILMKDPDAPSGTWVHWVAWNLPIVQEVPAGIPKQAVVERPLPVRQGMNTGKEVGYDGPCPPRRHGPHRYFVKVFILDKMLDLGPLTTATALEKAMTGHVLQEGQAMATYERN